MHRLGFPFGSDTPLAQSAKSTWLLIHFRLAVSPTPQSDTLLIHFPSCRLCSSPLPLFIYLCVCAKSTPGWLTLLEC